MLGKNVVHIGEDNGAGQSTKLCNQVIVVLNLLAVCEGLALATKSKIDIEKMLSAVKAGAAGSWQLSNLAAKILDRDLEPGFMVKTVQKDLRLVMEAAGDVDIALPGTSLVYQLYHAVEAEGLNDKGTQALIRPIERLAGIEVKK